MAFFFFTEFAGLVKVQCRGDNASKKTHDGYAKKKMQSRNARFDNSRTSNSTPNIDSTAPAAPNIWPTLPFVEETRRGREASLLAKTCSIARASISSPFQEHITL